MPYKFREELLHCFNSSCTSYHFSEYIRKKFLEAGFIFLDEKDAWELEPEQAYLLRRTDSSIIAFICPRRGSPRLGFSITAAHIDRPALKVKIDSLKWQHGLAMFGVQVYGSPIFSSWLDQELGLAGRAVSYTGEQAQLDLVKSAGPLCIIPNLAIHLNRNINKGTEYNPQEHLNAILTVDKQKYANEKLANFFYDYFSIRPDAELELFLYSWQQAQILGADDLFLAAGIDDLSMGFVQALALIEAFKKKQTSAKIRMATFLDHEEIGSRTYLGAASNFIPSTMKRIIISLNSTAPEAAYLEALNNSFLISLDGAHASHPNYSKFFAQDYPVLLGQGPAIKYSSESSYSSNTHSVARLRSLGANLPLQTYMPRSDQKTGSTVGPIIATKLGIMGVDIGIPMFAMHSLREMCKLSDLASIQNIVSLFFKL